MTDPFAGWPPIITDARPGRWVRLRDIVLTLMMWAFLLAILYTEMRFAWDSLMVLLGRSDAQIDAEMALFWQRMQPLLWLMGGLVVMLAFASLASRRRRDAAIAGLQPEPLGEAAIALKCGMSIDGMAAARRHRVVIVHRTADGSLRVEPSPGGVLP